MAFTLVDGVVLLDGFATPATAGTSQLVDGINNQAFQTPASATAQPVDGILGLMTWTAGAPAAVSLSSATTDGADTLAAVVTPVLAAIDLSSATTDGADTLAAAVSPIVGLSSATTDGADVLAAAVSVVVGLSSATTDGADILAVVVTPVSSGVSLSSATTDGADVLAAAVDLVVGLSSATADGADVLAAGVDVTTLSLDISALLSDGADTLSAYVAPVSEGFARILVGDPGPSPYQPKYLVKRKGKTWVFDTVEEAQAFTKSMEKVAKIVATPLVEEVETAVYDSEEDDLEALLLLM